MAIAVAVGVARIATTTAEQTKFKPLNLANDSEYTSSHLLTLGISVQIYRPPLRTPTNPFDHNLAFPNNPPSTPPEHLVPAAPSEAGSRKRHLLSSRCETCRTNNIPRDPLLSHNSVSVVNCELNFRLSPTFRSVSLS